jgi:N-acetylglucosaminylphosphatidylinositol deacetylase
MLLWIIFIGLFVLFVVSPIVFIHCYASKRKDRLGKTLLVIAHPDDECLFFAPTLLSLNDHRYILCLSNGDNERANEFRRSCEQLRVTDWNIVHDPIHLKDDQMTWWSAEAILGHIRKAVRQWEIQTIISFDRSGISGHRNHCSIYNALQQFSSQSSLQILCLKSLPIHRKYLTLVEFLRLKYFSNDQWIQFVLPSKDVFTPHRAMMKHRSQLLWFRYLYLLFSRYIWINDLQKISK